MILGDKEERVIKGIIADYCKAQRDKNTAEALLIADELVEYLINKI